MKNVKLLGSVLVIGALAALPAAAPTSAALDEDICEQTARMIREAAQREAYADYFLRIGSCLNDPDNAASCMREAREERDDALDLADDQFDAREDACDLLGDGPYDPDLDPSSFSANVTNPYFRLIPGRKLVYEMQTAEGVERVVVTTLADTFEIDGILCRAVTDVVTLNGQFIEDTVDWFAQHANGNVWYLGEIAKNFEDGLLDNLDGSWRSGREHARPGIVMLGSPTVGRAYRQEFSLNDAEDIARVISRNRTVTVPYGTFHNCVETEDWTPIEPGVFERKFYAQGIGLVQSVNLETGERLQLKQIIN